jgi:hypothetical protein
MFLLCKEKKELVYKKVLSSIIPKQAIVLQLQDLYLNVVSNRYLYNCIVTSMHGLFKSFKPY